MQSSPLQKARLYDLLPMHDPAAVLREVRWILESRGCRTQCTVVARAFDTVCRLFRGELPGYRGCTTGYHDLRHTLETFLAAARLIHGAVLGGVALPERDWPVCLIAALVHDTGYIQEAHDGQGTGGKYTAVHVDRSIDFLVRHARELGVRPAEIADCRAMIRSTDLTVDFATIAFSGQAARYLGMCLGTADLLAQMADRAYLEKLEPLYREFAEAGVEDCGSPAELVRRTAGFFLAMITRLDTTFAGVRECMARHFAARWHLDDDPYGVAIDNARAYLQQISVLSDRELYRALRRNCAVRGPERPVDG